jgi:hypothetical protein
MEAIGKLRALLALPRGIQPFQIEAGWAPEPESALEQKLLLSLTKIETQFFGSPASGLVATLTIGHEFISCFSKLEKN